MGTIRRHFKSNLEMSMVCAQIFTTCIEFRTYISTFSVDNLQTTIVMSNLFVAFCTFVINL